LEQRQNKIIRCGVRRQIRNRHTWGWQDHWYSIHEYAATLIVNIDEFPAFWINENRSLLWKIFTSRRQGLEPRGAGRNRNWRIARNYIWHTRIQRASCDSLFHVVKSWRYAYFRSYGATIKYVPYLRILWKYISSASIEFKESVSCNSAFPNDAVIGNEYLNVPFLQTFQGNNPRR
jgi:hypothetical protein